MNTASMIVEAIKPIAHTFDVRAWARKHRGVLAEARSLTARDTDLDRRINDRAHWAAIMARCVVGGKVGLIISGMDCDCVRYRYETVVDAPSGLFKLQRNIDREYMDAEGPHSVSYVRPDEARDGYSNSRDLVLEAYEDGHPGTVYDCGPLP